MIGDGMGYNCVLAADYYFGASSLCNFPVKLSVATFYYGSSYDPSQAWTDTSYITTGVTESAAAATALATGHKTTLNAVGLSPSGDSVMNLIEFAKRKGKSAGVISSVPFAHATPASFTVHNSSRSNYPEIAYDELLSSRCDVIMGCGNPEFDNDGNRRDTDWGYCGYVGDSTFWSELKKGSGSRTAFTANSHDRIVQDVDFDGQPDPWTLITSKDDFISLINGKTPLRVFGCPEVHSTLQQERSSDQGGKAHVPFETPLNNNVPTLAEMVKGGLNVLDNNPGGFFLMVEGGAIDWANHGNQPERMLEEMKGFRDAIDTVIAYIERLSSWEETLLIITADHECGNLWGGPPFVPIQDNGQGNMPTLQYNSYDHTNSLVPFYALGNASAGMLQYADENDPVRGKFIQNTEIPAYIFFLWK